MKRQTRLFLLAFPLLFAAPCMKPCWAGGLEKAVLRAREAGAPIFAMATSSYCAPCQMLKHRLQTEEELKGLISQYVGIHFDVGDPAFRKWTSKYKPKNMAVPMVFIVTSKGELIYNESGAPDSPRMAQILREGLRRNAEQAKAANSSDGWKRRTQAAREANELIEQGRYAAAIEVLKPYLTAADSAHPPDAPADDDPVLPLQFRLQILGQEHLDGAQADLANDRRQIFGLLALVKTRRLFGELPGLGEKIDETTHQVWQNRQQVGWLEQVEMVDRGRAAEQAGDYGVAVNAYWKVLAEYPDSLTSRLCAARILQIGSERTASRIDNDGGARKRR
jgi:hypothetical protein